MPSALRTYTHSGTMTWNDFGSHPPRRVGELAAALLDDRDPADPAENTWAGPMEPVTLTRVPGPARPLYQQRAGRRGSATSPHARTGTVTGRTQETGDCPRK
jgi:hypothetical protein